MNMDWTKLFVFLIFELFCDVSEAQFNRRTNVEFRFEEELPVGSEIGNVVQAARLRDVYTPEVVQRLRFRYLAPPTLDIAMEELTGRLLTSGRIDREAECAGRSRCEFKFKVAVQPSQYMQLIEVTLVVDDVNDHAPVFPQPSVSHQIPESAALGYGFSLPSAFDPDSPRFGVQNYTWRDASGRFRLEPTEKGDGSTDLRAVLVSELDREWRSEHRATVTATDGAGETGSMEIFVTVLDANDNNPVFQQREYEETIEENTAVGRSVLQVQATDDDAGDNGDVTYTFAARTRDKLGHLFEIDEVSGVIRVAGDIDFEDQRVYHLGLVARDRGLGSLPADATAIIHVTDKNDNAPTISINTLTDPGRRDDVIVSEVLEHAEAGAFVAHVTVSDMDEGANGLVDCFITSDHFQLDPIYGTEYTIVTKPQLDREERASFDFFVECADQGTPMMTSRATLHVRVGDVNDHSPHFQRHKYVANVDENNIPNLEILTVSRRFHASHLHSFIPN